MIALRVFTIRPSRLLLISLFTLLAGCASILKFSNAKEDKPIEYYWASCSEYGLLLAAWSFDTYQGPCHIQLSHGDGIVIPFVILGTPFLIIDGVLSFAVETTTAPIVFFRDYNLPSESPL